ncbi:reactivating factor for ethanolamine ammonia lyase [Geobacillus sp. BCO2]|nr:reactivating factor for ethanolamine ammonia lyase [Geobacillus sp. BCO2]
MQSTEISGATIHVASSRLPIRNLPIMMIELDHHQINNRDYVYKQIKQAMMDWKQYIQEDQELPFAICMKGIFHCSYSVLKEIAKILFLLYEKNFPNHSIIVVICEDDIAKAFGQLLVLQIEKIK